MKPCLLHHIKSRVGHGISAGWLVACLGMASAPAGATTLVPTNLAQLSEIAESAFVVKIEGVETSSTAEGRAFDVIRGTVVEPVFGDVQTSQAISWNQFKLGKNVVVPGMPVYDPGKEYLIFLTGKGPGTGFQSPVGFGQGAFAVRRNPETGAVMVQNQYRNSTLSAGLDVESVAEDIVEQVPGARAMSGQQRAKEVQRVRLQIQGRSANNLSGLKQAAQFFHEQKKQGRKPSMDYRTTGTQGKRVVR